MATDVVALSKGGGGVVVVVFDVALLSWVVT
jgi:hypothetical protein